MYLWKYVAVWFFLIRYSKILTLDNSEFYFCKIDWLFDYSSRFEEKNMENTAPDELMELIPANIRHHFVLRKRLIDSFTEVTSKIMSPEKDQNSISYNGNLENSKSHQSKTKNQSLRLTRISKQNNFLHLWRHGRTNQSIVYMTLGP